jgi:SulP family sulfate permease
MKIAFRPKLLDCLPGYNRAQFGKDLASGITVGVLARAREVSGAL